MPITMYEMTINCYDVMVLIIIEIALNDNILRCKINKDTTRVL